MTAISDDDRYYRYRYIARALSETRDHVLSQDTLAEIASRHVYVPVTKSWVQNHWASITRIVHEDYPDLWVFRPEWMWGWLVGATTNTSYPKLQAFERARVIATKMRVDINDGNLVGLARLDPSMATMLNSYQTFLTGADEMERQRKAVLSELSTLPVATEAMTRGL